MALILCLVLIFSGMAEKDYRRRRTEIRKYDLPNLQLQRKIPLFSGLRSQS